MSDRNSTLAGFADRLGVVVPPQDDGGLVEMSVDGKIPTFLQLNEAGTEAIVFAAVGRLSRENATEASRILLEANHFWMHTGGFTLALLPPTLNVMLSGRSFLDDGRVEGGPAGALHDLFDRFVSAARVWHDRVPTLGMEHERFEEDDQEDPDDDDV